MMKSIATVVLIASLLIAGSMAMAQTAPAPSPHDQHGQAPGRSPAPGHSSQTPMMGGGMMCPMMGPGMASGGMMGERGMMGMAMGPGMTGMSDPKAQARMLRLRGDMMKAMGDVLLKHAEAMEQGK